MPSVRLRVPATSANLGPGFDCLGLAVALYNEVRVEWGGHIAATAVSIEGEGAGELADENNATLSSMRLAWQALGRDAVAVRLHMTNRIPMARGLGSSAAAIVAGLAAARAVAGLEITDRDWLLRHAMLVEPHPDNIAAAVHGGLTASVLGDGDAATCLPLGRPRGVRVAFAVPSYKVSTQQARSVLPASYTREDVVFSASRAALLVGALVAGAHDLLGEASRDRIHTPARATLIPQWSRVRQAALDAGAAAVFISGSGPTVGAFVQGGHATAERVAHAMAGAFREGGATARPLWPALDKGGCKWRRRPRDPPPGRGGPDASAPP